MTRLISLYFLFCLFFQNTGRASDTAGLALLRAGETAMCKLAPQIITGETDSMRRTAGERLLMMLEETLSLPGSRNFSFDSLKAKTVSVLESPDKAFRIFTYNTILLNGKYLHYGMLQVYDKDRQQLYRMRDTAVQSIAEASKKELDPEHWYGALYYDIISFKHKKEKQYLLVGYDGSDIHSNRKLLDVLWFDHGEPVFGKEIFYEGTWKKTADCRAIYEFHNDSRMLMRYESDKKIVVLDQLAPAFPEAVNNFYYYIPTGDYDYYGLTRQGFWVKDALDKFNFGQGKIPKKVKKLPTPEKDPLNPDNLPPEQEE